MNHGQYGITPALGTEDALQKLSQTIEGCHNRDNDACLVILDKKGDFINL